MIASPPDASSGSGGGRRPGTVLLVVFALVMLVSSDPVVAASDFNWTNTVPALAPSVRLGHDMAYDSESDRVILFGGESAPTSNELNDETWAYDPGSNAWERKSPSPRPSNRFAHAMSYDSDSDRVILFGGWTGTEQSTETWAYDYNTNTWTRMNPALSPPVGVFVNSDYGTQSDRIVLFGGGTDRSVAIASNETWAYDFDSNAWTRRNPGQLPPRGGHGMAYDATSDRIVVFGGGDGGRDFGDTWAYDYNGDRWVPMNPQTSPSYRHGSEMVYQAPRDRVVLFGGVVGGDETWSYDLDGNAWTLEDKGTGPSSRFGARMAYDTKSDRIVLFGGSSGGNETWSYHLAPPPPPALWVYIAAAVGIGAAAAVAAVLLVRGRRRKRKGESGGQV